MSFGKCQECKGDITLEEYNSAHNRRPTGNEPSLCFDCMYRRCEAYEGLVEAIKFALGCGIMTETVCKKFEQALSEAEK